MNILILTDYYPPEKLGGVGEIARNLKREYEEKGHGAFVLTTGMGNEEDEKNGIFRSCEGLIRGVFKNNWLVLQIIRKYKIDVINLHQSTTTLFLFWKLFSKFPLIVNSFQVSYFSEFNEIHAVTVERRTFKPLGKEYIEKWIYAPIHMLLDFIGYIFSDVITVVSTENKKEFLKTYNRIRKRPIYIIPNGVNPLKFSSNQLSSDSELEARLKGKTVLTYVGVFRVRKRVFNLLYALKRITIQCPNVVLMLIGGGRGYEEEIMNLAEELDLAENLEFVGCVPNENIPYYLSLTDIFCTLSSYEGMPIAILEAMSMGRAVVTTRTSGMIDLFESKNNGFLTEIDDIQGIVEVLSKLIADKGLLQRTGDKAREDVLNNYTWDKIARQYIGLFKEFLRK